GQLAERGYEIDDIGNTGQASGPATIVHGPEGFLAAESVRAQLSEAELRMDEREGTGVDLLLGTGYDDLEEESAAAEALEQPAEMPEGRVAVRTPAEPTARQVPRAPRVWPPGPHTHPG